MWACSRAPDDVALVSAVPMVEATSAVFCSHVLEVHDEEATVSSEAAAALCLSIARLGIGCPKDTWCPDDPNGLYVAQEEFPGPREVLDHDAGHGVAAPAHDEVASVSGEASAVLCLSIARLGSCCPLDTWCPDDPHGIAGPDALGIQTKRGIGCIA